MRVDHVSVNKLARSTKLVKEAGERTPWMFQQEIYRSDQIDNPFGRLCLLILIIITIYKPWFFEQNIGSQVALTPFSEAFNLCNVTEGTEQIFAIHFIRLKFISATNFDILKFGLNSPIFETADAQIYAVL